MHSFAGEVFGLILDVVETNRAEDVKACLNYMDTLWDSWNTLPASFARSPTRLAFQKVYNMFCQRISNNQDAEVLGAVATVVAKLMPFNDPAGLNTPFNCNQHHIPMDESIGVSFTRHKCNFVPFIHIPDIKLGIHSQTSLLLIGQARSLAAISDVTS